MTENASTESLVTQAREGDRIAYGRLAERFTKRLRSLVRTRLGCALREGVELDDVVQETLRLALTGIDRFAWRGEDSFVRWLGAIAENVIRKEARQRAKQPAARETLELPVDGSSSPISRFRRQERFERLQQALRDLPSEYRQVILLSRIEGLKTAAIADRMGRSSAAVKQLLFRALKRLRETFGDTESLSLPQRSLESESDS